MKKILFTISIFSLILASTASNAANANNSREKLAEEYFSLPHVEKTYSELASVGFAPIAQMMTGMFEGCLEDGAQSKIEEYFVNMIPYEIYKEYLIETYAKNFTTEELQQILKYYRSSVAKKESKLIPMIAEMSGSIAENYMAKHEAKIQQNIDSIIQSSLKPECRR